MTKHIVIDARGLRSSTGRYTRNLLSYLQTQDQENKYTILVNQEDQAWWQPSSPNFTLKTTRYRHYSLGEQLGLYLQLRKFKPDLVHFAMPQQPLLWRRPTVTTIHDLTLVNYKNVRKSAMVYRVRQKIFKHLLRIVAKRSLAIITISNNSKTEISQFAGISDKKVVVTYPAAEKISENPEIINELQDTKFLLYVGTAHEHKNLKTLVDGFVELKKTHLDLTLAFAGKIDVRYEQLRRYVSQRELDDVHILGFVSEGALRWLYEHARCYVFPSFSEGFGLPAIEAMQYGLPVAASNASCIPEVCGNAAQYFDPNSPTSLAETVDAILSDSELQHRLQQAGPLQAARYSWDEMARLTHSVYMSALR